jgi:Tfp pilus assembly protein PilF
MRFDIPLPSGVLSGGTAKGRILTERSPHCRLTSVTQRSHKRTAILTATPDEAAKVLCSAMERDPLSAAPYHDLAYTYSISSREDEAMPQFCKALELDPDFHLSRLHLAFSLRFAGRADEAAIEFQTLAQSAPDLPYAQGALGYFYAVTGRPAEARRALEDLDQMARKRYVTHWARAIIYMGLGQKSVALDWLEKACEECDGWIWALSIEPWYAPLRNEPHFQALLGRVGPKK